MTSEKRQFNIAICGFGGMGDWHRETIGRIENLHLVGTYDIREERQEFARQHGITPYASYDEMIADPRVDIITIATPNDMHRPLAIKALQAGKNVVSEKPVTCNSADLQAIISVAEATGMLFTVHQNRRWDEDYRTVKEIVDQNLLGQVFRIESSVLGCRGIPGDWRQLPEHGGGMILDWGVHLIDQILQMVKEPIRTVYATVDNITNELVDDGFYTDITFASGLIAHIEVGTSHFIRKPRWLVMGRDGSAQVDWGGPSSGAQGRIISVTDRSKNDAVPIRTAAGLTKTMAPRTDDTIKESAIPEVHCDILDYYRNVMDAIDGLTEIEVKLPEVVRVMKVMEAIKKSAATRSIVDFGEC